MDETLSQEAEELKNYMRGIPAISYEYAKMRLGFDIDKAAEELRQKRGYNIVKYPAHGKPYGLRLVGGKWAK